MSEAPEAAASAPLTRDPINKLDAVLVIGVLLIIGGVCWVLAYRDVPQANLAILASIVSGLMGAVIGGYAGYRWGASDALKRAQATIAAK